MSYQLRLHERMVGKERPRTSAIQHDEGTKELYARAGVRLPKARTITPQKTKNFEALVAAEFTSKFGKPRLTGPVGVDICYSGSRVDIDNGAKSILDALQHIAYENDSQVERLVVNKHPKETPVGIVITVYPLGGQE